MALSVKSSPLSPAKIAAYQSHHSPMSQKKKQRKKRRRASTMNLELQKLKSHPILLTSPSFHPSQNNINPQPSTTNRINNRSKSLPHSLSVTQLAINQHLKIIKSNSSNNINPTNKKLKRPSSAPPQKTTSFKIPTFMTTNDQIRLKKLRPKPQRRRPMSARLSRDAINLNKSPSVEQLFTASKNNQLSKPITIIKSRTPRGAFMIQQSSQSLLQSPSKPDKNPSTPQQKAKSRKRRKRASSAHHIVLKHQKRESPYKSSQKCKLLSFQSLCMHFKYSL